MIRALWIIQGLLALLFLFAGGTKLVLPVAEMTKQMPMLSGSFLRFVGVCEVLGGIGLILPGLLRTRQWLTPLAAACLVVIMIGATVLTLLIPGLHHVKPRAGLPRMWRINMLEESTGSVVTLA